MAKSIFILLAGRVTNIIGFYHKAFVTYFKLLLAINPGDVKIPAAVVVYDIHYHLYTKTLFTTLRLFKLTNHEKNLAFVNPDTCNPDGTN
jgi:hypothetical protein